MSDPLAPPPRRRAPESLRADISRQLATTTTDRARRPVGRYVAIPLIAASLVATIVLGLTSLQGRQTLAPAESAEPRPPSSSSMAAPTPSTSAPSTPAPSPSVDVRSMTKAEIAKDVKTCLSTSDGSTPVSSYKPIVAMVQHPVGVDGPSTRTQRRLILQADGIIELCVDGESSISWSSEHDRTIPTGLAGVVEQELTGGHSADCGATDADTQVDGGVLIRTGSEVESARVRLVVGKTNGPWQTTTPRQGRISMPVMVTGAATLREDMKLEAQILDADGAPLPMQVYGKNGYESAKTSTSPMLTCAEEPELPEPTRPKYPKTDAAGIKTCLSMAEEYDESISAVNWQAKLLISTDDEWGVVLSDGSQRFGCSLFPTAEMSDLEPDVPSVKRADFYFALNPVTTTNGESLWAAGRVPDDVTSITYRLPGKVDIEATIDDGYWMVKHHDLKKPLDPDDREPVVVTVTRETKTQRFTLPFDETTMCHQVSHGC